MSTGAHKEEGNDLRASRGCGNGNTAATISTPTAVETFMLKSSEDLAEQNKVQKEQNKIQLMTLENDKKVSVSANMMAKDLLQTKLSGLHAKADRLMQRMKMVLTTSAEYKVLSDKLDELEEDIDEAEEERKALVQRIFAEEEE